MHGSVREKASDDCTQILAEKRWYAAYTRPQHERSVADQAVKKGLEVLLPLAPIRRNWKQRVVHLPTPLFPGYVFVRMRLDERLKVLSIPSAVRLVSFNGKAAAISDTEIDAVRNCVTNGIDLQSHAYLDVGRWVRIKSGALQGIKGVVVEQNSTTRLVVSIQLLQLALAVTVDAADLEPVLDA
jgi:transcription antitermination factor NusG